MTRLSLQIKKPLFNSLDGKDLRNRNQGFTPQASKQPGEQLVTKLFILSYMNYKFSTSP